VAIAQSLTVRQAALVLDGHRNTTFRWRHRFLTWIKQDRPSVLNGIAETDETYSLESHKGSRKPRKRGGIASKRGISVDFVTGNGTITKESTSYRTLKTHIRDRCPVSQ